MSTATLISADRVRLATGVSGNAVLIEQGRVERIGYRDELLTPGMRELTFPGATIAPGLRDAHFHAVPYTAAISGISLKTASSIAEVGARLRTRAPVGAGPVVAIRLDDEALEERRLPTRQDLDAALGGRPVLVHRYCGHVAVASSAALALAGVDAGMPDPPGGVIDRDAEGVPTGVLRETAIDPVADRLAAASRVSPGELNKAMTGLAGLGITSIGAMTRLGHGPWGTLGNEADTLLEAAPGLPIRARAYLVADSVPELESYADAMRQAPGLLAWSGLKRFGDGSFGGHTAAMYEGFSDQPESLGTLRLAALDEELARACLGLGGSVAIHAIGDRAVAEVLDVFERLVADGADPGRLRIEHASVMRIEDIERIGRLGVIASVQPAFMGSETEWLERRMGRERLPLTYPFASLERAGAVLAGGSDCPVEPPDPWSGMALARDRAGIVPAQGLSAASAFAMFTSGAAAALGEADPLSPGSPADLLVVDRDPVEVEPDELRETRVVETFVAGRRVEVDRSLSTWNE